MPFSVTHDRPARRCELIISSYCVQHVPKSKTLVFLLGLLEGSVFYTVRSTQVRFQQSAAEHVRNIASAARNVASSSARNVASF